MKHTVQQLIDTAYLYFPRIPPFDPLHEHTPEVQRQRDAHERARVQYPTWTALLARLAARFPEERWPGVRVQDLCLFYQAEGQGPYDRCFSAYLWLPTREAAEVSHTLTFRVSVVVPYYSIKSASSVHSTEYYVRMGAGSAENGGAATDVRETYELSPDELPYAMVIEEAIQASFPGHEQMSAAVGTTVVPDIFAGSRMPGEATLYDCLFSDCW